MSQVSAVKGLQSYFFFIVNERDFEQQLRSNDNVLEQKA